MTPHNIKMFLPPSNFVFLLGAVTVAGAGAGKTITVFIFAGSDLVIKY